MKVSQVKKEISMEGIEDFVELDKDHVYFLQPHRMLSQGEIHDLKIQCGELYRGLGIKCVVLNHGFDIYKLEK